MDKIFKAIIFLIKEYFEETKSNYIRNHISEFLNSNILYFFIILYYVK